MNPGRKRVQAILLARADLYKKHNKNIKKAKNEEAHSKGISLLKSDDEEDVLMSENVCLFEDLDLAPHLKAAEKLEAYGLQYAEQRLEFCKAEAQYYENIVKKQKATVD